MNCFLAVLAAALTVAASSTTVAPADDCNDNPTSDCWSKPNSNCFGIYEAWSRAHCPLRCGFCPGKPPPCEDALDYCSQFEDNTCVDDNYAVWARKNCRKHCNLCQVPTPPSGVSTQKPGAVVTGPQVTAAVVTGGSTPALPDNVSLPPNNNNNIVATGIQKTIMIQGGGQSGNVTDACVYKGKEYKVGFRWNDGCDYECSCMDTDANRIVCTEKCTKWDITPGLSACVVVQEDGECCVRVEC